MNNHTNIARLSQPAAYLAAIVESSDDAIISKDLNSLITSWNGAAERTFGYKESEVIGQPISLIIPPERLSEETAIMEKLRSGQRIDHFDTVRVARDGRRIDVSLTISPILDENGHVIGASKIARDITSRKEMEKTLEGYTRRLERINNELEDITQIASHDLKEPLRGLCIKAQLLLEDYGDKLDEGIVKQLKDLVKLSQRSSQLIEDLLNFSRIGKEHVSSEEVNLNEIVKDIAVLLESRLKEKNARIDVPRVVPHFRGNKKGIAEVVRNLITNAIIYNDKPKPVVEIGFMKEMDAAHGLEKNVFYVRDNGIGIAPEFHKNIFRLFKRLPTAKQYNNKGTGIGLALVKKIIDQCSGHVWLDSEEGKGTTFYFTVGDSAML